MTADTVPQVNVSPELASLPTPHRLIYWAINSVAGQSELALSTKLAETCLAPPTESVLANIEHYKTALRNFGRNPNRYRISSDALLRRVAKEKMLPPMPPIVEMGNLISLITGWPVGCYQQSSAEGSILLRLGKAKECMPSMAKGMFDIEHLPILVDGHGPFGSPISDSPRTRIQDETVRCLCFIYAIEPLDVPMLTSIVRETSELAGVKILHPLELI